MQTYLRCMAAVLLSFFLTVNSKAQINIPNDTVIHGHINSGGEVDSFKLTVASASEKLTLLLDDFTDTRFTAFFPRLEIYNPNGALIKALISYGAARFDTTLDAGTYTIRVMDDNYYEGGDFGFTVKRLLPASGIPIGYETTYQGSISPRPQIDAYRFTIGVGTEKLTLLLDDFTDTRFTSFFPRLEIYDPNGARIRTLIATNTARLDTTLTSGTYTIWIMDDNYFEGGDYGFTLKRLNPPSGTSVGYDTTYQGSISPRPQIDAYRFTTNTAEKLTLLLDDFTDTRFTAFYPRLEIYDSNGTLVKTIISTGSARFDTALNAGTYIVWVMDDNYFDAGDYGFTIKRLNPPSGTPIGYDTTYSGSISPRPQIDAYRLTVATASEKLTLLLDDFTDTRFTSFYPRLEIYDPGGTLIKTLISYGSARFDTTLNAGNYTIWVMDDNYFEAGDYGFTIKRLSPPNGTFIQDTSLIGSISPRPQIDAYVFNSTPDNKISLTLTNLTDTRFTAFYPRLEVYNSSGTLLKTLIAGGSVRFDTTLNVGTYIVWVMDDNYFEGGNYSLSFVSDSFPQNSICVPPDTSITAWWPFEGSGTTVTDIANGYNGVNVNGAVYKQGRVNSALKFDGVDDYIGIPDNDKWAFGKKNFSIEFWANFDAVGSGDVSHPSDVFISHDEGSGSTRKWYFGLRAGFLYFHVDGPGLGAKELVQAPFAPLIGKWYHLAVTRQGNVFSLYVNGALKASNTSSDSIPNPNAPLLIGKFDEQQLGNVNTSVLSGSIDEMTIYSRALSAVEILAIANAANAGKCKNLTITTTALPAVRLGDSLSFIFNAIQGQPPYSWKVIQGYLPNGVILDSNGRLKGVPAKANEFTFKVRVTDGSQSFAEKEFLLKVLLTLPSPEILTNKSSTTPVPGRILTTIITVENQGSTVAKGFRTVDFLDSSLKIQKISPGGIAVQPNIVSWNIPDLQPGGITILNHESRIEPSAPLGKNIAKTICTNKDWAEISECLKKIEPSLLCNSLCGLECILCLLCPGEPFTCFPCTSVCAGCGVGCIGLMVGEVNKCVENKPGCKWPLWGLILLGPIDPNEIVVLPHKYIQPNQKLVYSIHYENIGNIEAQDIFIWDTLDNNLDVSTLQILTPGGTFTPSSRTIKWNLLNKNLQPGATDNVLLSIKPKPNLPSGTVIKNRASIQFEIFDTVHTNEVVNVIDAVPPKSSMFPLDAVSLGNNIFISWSGTDSIGEIESYSIFVSENGEPFKLYQQTAASFLIFTGEAGKTYRFVSIAKDVAGNVEVKNPLAEATTTIMYLSDTLCIGGSTKFISDVRESGSTYRWQANDGTGYRNIADTGIYSGSLTDTLRLSNVPSFYAGYKYRCLVASPIEVDTSTVHALVFANLWTGAVSTAWEAAGNWSCGSVPDAHTDVIIQNGVPRYPIVNSEAWCRSVKARPEISVTVTAGRKLNVTGAPK